MELVACLEDSTVSLNLDGPADRARALGPLLQIIERFFFSVIIILSIPRIIFLLIIGIDKRHAAAASARNDLSFSVTIIYNKIGPSSIKFLSSMNHESCE